MEYNYFTTNIRERENIGIEKKEAQGLGALLDKMEDNDHITLDNIEI